MKKKIYKLSHRVWDYITSSKDKESLERKRMAVFAYGSVLTICIIAFMAAGSQEDVVFDTMRYDEMVAMEADFISKSDSVMSPVASSDYIHAGADEKYPDKGYDDNGWSYRGYMSSYEMAGKHCKDKAALVRFELYKAKVKIAFVDSMKVKALDICKGTSVPPSILVAQAIVETNFGTSRLKVVANNLFGHMYKGNVTADGITGKLHAYDRNKAGNSKKYYFRTYASVWWSMKHHLYLLEGKYADRLIDADIPEREKWMAALCGCKDSEMKASDSDKAAYLYAGACAWKAKDKVTSRYVAELRFIIRLYNLHKLDDQWRTKN